MKRFFKPKRTLQDEIDELAAMRKGGEGAHLKFIKRIRTPILRGIAGRLRHAPDIHLIKQDAFQEGWLSFRDKALNNPEFVPQKAHALESFFATLCMGHARNMLKKKPTMPNAKDICCHEKIIFSRYKG